LIKLRLLGAGDAVRADPGGEVSFIPPLVVR
jgi:hypothetical protein